MIEFNPLKDPCCTCGLWKDKKHPCIRPLEKSLTTGGIVLIGEAPGGEEDASGTAFIGPAGKILRNCLGRLTITGFVLLNAVACRPTKAGANRTPTTHEIHYCQDFLRDSLSRIQPAVIVCLGLVAAKSLGLTGKMRDLRNREWCIDRHTWTSEVVPSGVLVPCFVTYHPAASMRPGQKHLAQVMEEDIALYLGRMPPYPETAMDERGGVYFSGSALKSDSRKALTNEPKCEIIPIESEEKRDGSQGPKGDRSDGVSAGTSTNSRLPDRVLPSGTTAEMLVLDIENDGFLKDKDPFPFGDKDREIWVIGTDKGRVQGYVEES